ARQASIGNYAQDDGGLPALRSAGLSLVATDRAAALVAALRRSQALDAAFAAGTPPPPPLVADDLVLGHRLGIWASRAGRSPSLHRRHGTYRLGENGDGPSLDVLDEEGFLQLTAVQPSADPSRPEDPDLGDPSLPPSRTDLFLHERMARWDGWSLSVQRPGKALSRHADPYRALEDDPTANTPVTPFKLQTTFRVTRGSLPPLRFGATYRMRA